MTIFGIPVIIHWTTILMALLVSVDAFIYIKKAQKGVEKGVLWAAGVISIFVVLSVVLHEVAHGLAAAAFGIKIVGAGINGLGAFVAPAGSFAEYGWFAELCVAIAGPASNALLALLAAAYVAYEPESLPENTIQYFGYINTRLARMNMWPLVILDGAKVVHALAWAIFGYSLAQPIVYIAGVITIVYLFLKKKGRWEIEDLFMNL